MVVAAYGLILPQWVLDAMSPEFSAGPSQGRLAPSGGSAAREAASLGAQFSAGPSQGKLAPSGGSAAREAASVGAQFSAGPSQGKLAPPGGSAAREAASVGAQKFGCFNIHASVLPRWRGAAPIHRAIEAGDLQTGVTIMQMDAGLDTGDMLLVEKLAITPADTTGTLHDKLAALGGRMVIEALELAACGGLTPVKQPAEGVTYARKIEKHEAAIDWTQGAAVIARRIRAFNPFPGAASRLAGETIKFWQATVLTDCRRPEGAAPGQILAASGQGVDIAAMDGVLRATRLQKPGGKALEAAEFVRGFALQPGMVFSE
jgi:methionyl-tRNA formyltransferase